MQIIKDLKSLPESGTQNGLQYEFLIQKHRDLEQVKIEGYKKRTKQFLSFHQDEPDIAFYAKAE